MVVPEIEVVERPNAMVVRADLPGVKPDEVSVTVDDGLLTISGERREERREERDGVVHSEVAYGAFSRDIPLPDGADDDRISASFRDGVLEIEIPVDQQRSRGRRIAVRS
jgi:HSP20 family protein